MSRDVQLIPYEEVFKHHAYHIGNLIIMHEIPDKRISVTCLGTYEYFIGCIVIHGGTYLHIIIYIDVIVNGGSIKNNILILYISTERHIRNIHLLIYQNK